MSDGFLSRMRCVRSTRFGGRLPCSGPFGSRRRSRPRPTFIINMRASSPAGSHKVNTSIAQAYFNKVAGTKRLATETGAGQWGASLALACRLFGLECTVYMVKVSYQHKPYRRMLMHTWGATVHPSPSDQTEYGRKLLAEIRSAREAWGWRSAKRFRIPSPIRIRNTRWERAQPRLPAPNRHRSGSHPTNGDRRGRAGRDFRLRGRRQQFRRAGLPVPAEEDHEKKHYRIVAVEPSACPSFTKGELRYDFGDTAQQTPLLMMYTLGHDFMPPPIHAGGLRYHGMAPLVSHALKLGLIEAQANHQTKVFESGTLFARTEGIVPAPESAHAIHAVVESALQAKKEGKKKVLLFNLSGNGLLDLSADETYLAGKLQDV